MILPLEAFLLILAYQANQSHVFLPSPLLSLPRPSSFFQECRTYSKRFHLDLMLLLHYLRQPMDLPNTYKIDNSCQNGHFTIQTKINKLNEIV